MRGFVFWASPFFLSFHFSSRLSSVHARSWAAFVHLGAGFQPNELKLAVRIFFSFSCAIIVVFYVCFWLWVFCLPTVASAALAGPGVGRIFSSNLKKEAKRETKSRKNLTRCAQLLPDFPWAFPPSFFFFMRTAKACKHDTYAREAGRRTTMQRGKLFRSFIHVVDPFAPLLERRARIRAAKQN